MDNNNVIHVRLREPAPGMEQDYYFGSMTVIYDVLPEQAVGVKLNSLRCRFARLGYRFINHRCTIRRGKVYRKKMNKNK